MNKLNLSKISLIALPVCGLIGCIVAGADWLTIVFAVGGLGLLVMAYLWILELLQ